jgi:hypothetical protein
MKLFSSFESSFLPDSSSSSLSCYTEGRVRRVVVEDEGKMEENFSKRREERTTNRRTELDFDLSM